MKFIYTFACFIGATTLGMIFASGLSWLCTFPFSHALFIALIALLVLYVFSGSVKDNGWKKSIFQCACTSYCRLVFYGMCSLVLRKTYIKCTKRLRSGASDSNCRFSYRMRFCFSIFGNFLFL